MFERVPNTSYPCLPEDIGFDQYRSLAQSCVQILLFTIVYSHPFLLTSVAVCHIPGLHCVSCKFNGREAVRVLAQLSQMVLSAGLLLISSLLFSNIQASVPETAYADLHWRQVGPFRVADFIEYSGITLAFLAAMIRLRQIGLEHG